MKGITLAEVGHPINLLPPRDGDTVATPRTFSMAMAAHVSIFLTLGVTGAAITVTLEACSALDGSGNVALPFTYYAETTPGDDTLGARTLATTAGFSTSTNDGIFYVIEVDAAELPDGKPILRLVLSDPGAATFVSAIAVQTGLRYQGIPTATAIA